MLGGRVSGSSMIDLSSIMMSLSMPHYPAWIAYFTTVIYTVIFAVVSFLVDDNPIRPHHFHWINQKYYLGMAALTAIGGLLFQFSAAWVQPDLVQVLAATMTLQMAIFEFVLFKERRKDYNLKSVFYLLVVFAGIAVGAYPQLSALGQPQPGQEGANDWYWIVCVVVASFFVVSQQTYQDVALHNKDAQVTPTSSLVWMNFYSIPINLLAIFFQCIPIVNGRKEGMSVNEAFASQGDAFSCFFGTAELSDDCQKGATTWVLIYCVSYVGLFSVVSYMMNKFGMVFPAVVGSNITLLATLTFTQKAIVGDHTTDFSWPIMTGCVMIVLGVIGRGVPSNQDNKTSRTPIPYRSFNTLPIINADYRTV